MPSKQNKPTTLQSEPLIARGTLSFPHLANTAIFNGLDTGKFMLDLLVGESSSEQYKMLDKSVETFMVSCQKQLDKNLTFHEDHICLRRCTNYQGREDEWYLRLSNSRVPILRNRDGSQMTAEEIHDYLYAGAEIRAAFRMWLQQSFGTKINGSLLQVQFINHGEKLGQSESDGDPLGPIEEEDTIQHPHVDQGDDPPF